MERLTFKVEDGNYIENPERVNGKIVGTRSCLKKLGELEDLEEQGLLVKLSKNETADANGVRLVDANWIISVAEGEFPEEDVSKIRWLLAHIRTAYDEEKVEEQVRSYFKGVIDKKDINTSPMEAVGFSRDVCDIIRKGGA